MGFRNLTLFNDSLLAKQGWRLLKNTNSLFFKVFKAKFFPNCTIMEARDSRSGSYALRSILQGRDVLLKGARWCIGNGKSVKIWQHHWLPRKHPPLLSSPSIPSLEEATDPWWIFQLRQKRGNGIMSLLMVFFVHKRMS